MKCKDCKHFKEDVEHTGFGECSALTFDTNYFGGDYDTDADIVIPNGELLGEVILVRDCFGCVKFQPAEL